MTHDRWCNSACSNLRRECADCDKVIRVAGRSHDDKGRPGHHAARFEKLLRGGSRVIIGNLCHEDMTWLRVDRAEWPASAVDRMDPDVVGSQVSLGSTPPILSSLT